MNICLSCPDGHPVSLPADKLGQEVACPRCLATFRAEWAVDASLHAGKVRRSRDDDDEEDDEEEEERPKKKKTPPKAAPAKKPARKARDDDDDDDEEDDDADAGEPEPEIEWTRRKIQLFRCATGLTIMMIAFYTLMAMLVILMLEMDYDVFELGNAANGATKVLEYKPAAWAYCGYIIAPFVALAQTILMVGLCFSLFAPARAEARGMAIGGLIFGGLVYLFGVLIILSQAKIISTDAARADNMTRLLGGAAAICFAFSVMSAMAYMSKLMVFVKLHLEASQPITNAMFFFLHFVAMFAIFVANPYVCGYIFWFACFALIIAVCAAAAMGARACYAQAMVFLKVRKIIMGYIRDD